VGSIERNWIAATTTNKNSADDAETQIVKIMSNKKFGWIVLAVLATLAVVGWHYADCFSMAALLRDAATGGLCLAAAPVVLTQEQVDEFKLILDEVKGGWSKVKSLPDSFKLLEVLPGQVKTLQDENEKLLKEVNEVRRLMAVRSQFSNQVRVPGIVSDDCARHLAALAISARVRSGKEFVNGERLAGMAKDILGVEQKAALTSSDIPLPTEYSGQVVELVSQFGTARKYGTVYPLGAGTVKLPKLGTDTTFGLIASSATVTEKSPTVSFVTFTAEKFGGLVRIPSELDDDSIVALGQFIARYSARQIASVEDSNFWVGTGAGSGVNGSVAGLTASTITNSKVTQMASTKTHYSDATLANFRALRSVPDEPAIRNGVYYVHTTFEQLLSSFNTAGDKPFMQNGTNGLSLDGFPIRLIHSMTTYSVSANVSKVFALFGDVSFQYLGIRGGVRFDTSVDAAFATDEILIRALERFTIGLMATGAVAGLETAAS